MVRNRIFRGINKYLLFYTGLFIVLFFIIVAVFAPYISPYDPTAVHLSNVLAPPSLQHFFGTDELGRDVFSRVVYGSRISISVGFVAVGISVVIGLIFGC